MPHFSKGFRLDLSDDWFESEKEKGKNCASEKVKEKENQTRKVRFLGFWRNRLVEKTGRKGQGKVPKKEKEEEMKETEDETGKKEALAKRRIPEMERKEAIEPLAGGEKGMCT